MIIDNMFSVESVEPCNVPTGVPIKGEWCRYVVASPRSRVIGRYQGTLRQAKKNAESLVTDLNNRARGGQSPFAPRGRTRRSGTKKARSTAVSAAARDSGPRGGAAEHQSTGGALGRQNA